MFSTRSMIAYQLLYVHLDLWTQLCHHVFSWGLLCTLYVLHLGWNDRPDHNQQGKPRIESEHSFTTHKTVNVTSMAHISLYMLHYPNCGKNIQQHIQQQWHVIVYYSPLARLGDHPFSMHARRGDGSRVSITYCLYDIIFIVLCVQGGGDQFFLKVCVHIKWWSLAPNMLANRCQN